MLAGRVAPPSRPETMRRDTLGLLVAALAFLAAACGNANYACVGACSSGVSGFDGTISASSAQDAEVLCTARMVCSELLPDGGVLPGTRGPCTCIQE